jgi:hypothetical protein
VQPGDGVVGEQRLLPPGQRQVVPQVGGGLGEVHRLDREPGGDSLVQGGEHAHPQLPVEGGLPGQDPGERAGGVHLRVGQQPQLFKLGRVQEMSLIADHDDLAVSFCGLGGEQVTGLGHQLGFEIAGLGAQRPDDRDVKAAGAKGRVGDVDDLVAGGIQAGDGRAQRHRLARADVAGNYPERGLGDAEADPGDGLGVGLAGKQVFGGDPLAERGAGQPEVGGPGRPGHGCCSWSPVDMASRAKSIFAPVPASSSWAAATRPR